MHAKHFPGLLLAIPLAAILLVSGCTTTGITPASGNGMVVKEFGPDFSQVYASEPVTFRMLIQNTGSVDAINGHAELLGLDEDWCGSQMNKCTTSQGGRPEMLPNEDVCKYTSTGFKLAAPDTQRGTSGGTQICTWSYNAPPLQQGFTITYTPTVRLYYSYKSYVSKLITFGSSSEVRALQDSGGKLPAETVSSTTSPVQLSIDTKGPIRYSPEQNAVIFPLEISITNAGGGTACAKDGMTYAERASSDNACRALSAGETSQNRISLRITFGSSDSSNMALSSDCQGFASGKLISLAKGQSNSFVCYVTASGLTQTGAVQRMITAEAIYDYYTDTSTSVTVIGRMQMGSGN